MLKDKVYSVEHIFNNYYRRRRSEYCQIIPENNCFSIIAQVIIRATVFSFILLVFSVKTSRNRAACFSIIITSREVIIARYDVILDQSERAHLYNHLSNFTNILYSVIVYVTFKSPSSLTL